MKLSRRNDRSRILTPEPVRIYHILLTPEHEGKIIGEPFNRPTKLKKAYAFSLLSLPTAIEGYTLAEIEWQTRTKTVILDVMSEHLDWILVSKAFAIRAYEVSPHRLSDQLSVVAKICLASGTADPQ